MIIQILVCVYMFLYCVYYMMVVCTCVCNWSVGGFVYVLCMYICVCEYMCIARLLSCLLNKIMYVCLESVDMYG